MSKKQFSVTLFAIILLASILRLWGLERGDLLNDEALYAFRAIGLVDYFHETAQTTPIEWFDPDPPWWTKFSFHDHPPLIFLIQHAFIKVFGEYVFAFRLPSVIFGVLSVYLTALLGARLFSKEAGLLSAAILAATVNHVFISRTGMQESFVIFLMLAALCAFCVSLEKKRFLILAAALTGLAVLTKYTAIILLPVFFSILLLRRRDYFLSKEFLFAVFCFLLLVSPIIIYNIGLFSTADHFDFQISSALGSRPEIWRIAPGKDIGTVKERIADFLPSIWNGNSWIFLSLFALSAAAFLVKLFRDQKDARERYGFLTAVFAWLFLLFLVIGPSIRFLTMLTPFFALGTGVLLLATRQKLLAAKPIIDMLLFAIIIALEVFYSFNNQIAYYPRGPQPWLASKIRYENYNIGYQELEKYLSRELTGKMPAVVFDADKAFLNRLQRSAIARAKKENREPVGVMIVYYGNFDKGPRLWTMDRLLIYHGWPVIDFATYAKIKKENGDNFFTRSGIANTYFIERTNIVPDPEFLSAIRGAHLTSIYNKNGDEAFRAYMLR